MTVGASHQSLSSSGWAQANPARSNGHRAGIPASFEVAAIGNRGYDGAVIDWNRARAWSLRLGDLGERLDQSGVLELVSTGHAAGFPERALTTLTFKRIGRTFHLAYDFGRIGARSVAVEVRCGGRTVAYRSGVADMSAVIDGLGGHFSPWVSHDRNGDSGQGRFSAAVSWSRPAAIRVADKEVWTGDELVVYPEGATLGAGVRFVGTVCLHTTPAGHPRPVFPNQSISTVMKSPRLPGPTSRG